MKRIFLLMIILLIIFVGSIWLQIFLSKRENKWLGLILPFISFSFSLLMVFQIHAFEAMRGGELLGLVASTFLISNIPAIVFLAIYFGCREKIKRRKDLEKMNIQDLE